MQKSRKFQQEDQKDCESDLGSLEETSTLVALALNGGIEYETEDEISRALGNDDDALDEDGQQEPVTGLLLIEQTLDELTKDKFTKIKKDTEKLN